MVIFEARNLDPAFHDLYHLRTAIVFPITAFMLATISAPISTALIAELLAIAFRRTANWNGPRDEILERFE